MVIVKVLGRGAPDPPRQPFTRVPTSHVHLAGSGHRLAEWMNLFNAPRSAWSAPDHVTAAFGPAVTPANG
jgi:hypothetical protein